MQSLFDALGAFFKSIFAVFSKTKPSTQTTSVVTPIDTTHTQPPIIPDPVLPPVTLMPQSAGFLVCPIKADDASGKPVTSRTVQISSILDHSGTAIDPASAKRWGLNAKDQKVRAFNGEVGDGIASSSAPFGYTKKVPAPFFVSKEIHYVGSYDPADQYGSTYYLNYDGHAGYDFSYPKLTPVVATAAGRLYKAASGTDPTYGANWDKDHSFYIQHDNGYKSWFRHCEKLHPDIEAVISGDFSQSCTVAQGQVVAYVGNVGTGAVHLHVEVLNNNNAIVDPYGDKLWRE